MFIPSHFQSENPCTISVNGEQPEVPSNQMSPSSLSDKRRHPVPPTRSLSASGNMLPISINLPLSQREVEEESGTRRDGGIEKGREIECKNSEKEVGG